MRGALGIHFLLRMFAHLACRTNQMREKWEMERDKFKSRTFHVPSQLVSERGGGGCGLSAGAAHILTSLCPQPNLAYYTEVDCVVL